MAITTQNPNTDTETTHSTKRVFMRAEHNDEIELHEISLLSTEGSIPKNAIIVKRNLTYYGPKLRIESLADSKQYLLTIPGPESEAILWELVESGWVQMAEVTLEFGESLPQYDMCLHCNEPLSTVSHRRRAAVGGCTRD